MKIKFWPTWRLLRLTPGAQGVFYTLDVLYPIVLVMNMLMFRWKKYDFYNLKLEQAIRNLACGDQQILLVVISVVTTVYWRGLKLRELVINDWVHVFPRAVSRDSGRVMDRWNDIYLFGRFLLGGSNAEKLGWPSKGEFLQKFYGTLHEWRSHRNCYINLGQYFIHAWLDFLTNCRNSLPCRQLVN